MAYVVTEQDWIVYESTGIMPVQMEQAFRDVIIQQNAWDVPAQWQGLPSQPNPPSLSWTASTLEFLAIRHPGLLDRPASSLHAAAPQNANYQDWNALHTSSSYEPMVPLLGEIAPSQSWESVQPLMANGISNRSVSRNGDAATIYDTIPAEHINYQNQFFPQTGWGSLPRHNSFGTSHTFDRPPHDTQSHYLGNSGLQRWACRQEDIVLQSHGVARAGNHRYQRRSQGTDLRHGVVQSGQNQHSTRTPRQQQSTWPSPVFRRWDPAAADETHKAFHTSLAADSTHARPTTSQRAGRGRHNVTKSSGAGRGARPGVRTPVLLPPAAEPRVPAPVPNHDRPDIGLDNPVPKESVSVSEERRSCNGAVSVGERVASAMADTTPPNQPISPPAQQPQPINSIPSTQARPSRDVSATPPVRSKTEPRKSRVRKPPTTTRKPRKREAGLQSQLFPKRPQADVELLVQLDGWKQSHQDCQGCEDCQPLSRETMGPARFRRWQSDHFLCTCAYPFPQCAAPHDPLGCYVQQNAEARMRADEMVRTI